MSSALNGTTLALSIVAAVFLGISCISYSTDDSILESIPWFTATRSTPGWGADVEYYFGLRAFLGTASRFGTDVEVNIEFDDQSECGRNGNGAFAMSIIGCVLATATAVLSGVSLCTKSFLVQISTLVAGLISFSTSLVGVGLFMGNCYHVLSQEDDNYFGNPEMKWGPGAILAIIGMLLMFIASALQIAVNCMGAKAGAGYAPPATSAPPVSATEMIQA